MEKLRLSDIKVIIPTLNEEKSIAEIIQELRQIGCHNILIADGNSEDKTVNIAQELGANVIVQNGRGKGAALRQAFNHADLDGNISVMMLASLTNL